MKLRLLGPLLALVVAGCSFIGPTTMPSFAEATPSRPLGTGEVWLPTFPARTADGIPIACAGVGFPDGFRVHGSSADPHTTWMIRPDGTRQELVWPIGYSARFTPGLEILDDHGRVFAHEGSLVEGGCEMPPPGSMWVDFIQQ